MNASENGAATGTGTPVGTASGPATRAEYCVIACAEAWRGGGEILASPMGAVPSVGARLARLTFAPELLLTDGEATLVGPDGEPEGWLPLPQASGPGDRR